MIGARLALLETRMKFDLVDRRHHAGRFNDPVEMLGQEIRHADRPGLARLAKRDQALPCLDIAILGRHRPMDQIEIDRLDTQ